MTFYPHQADFIISRSEPSERNLPTLTKRALHIQEVIAERIVFAAMMSRSNSKKKNREVTKKIRALDEHNDRLEGLEGFLESWNRWSLLYLNAPPVQPRYKGQITAAENAMTIAREAEIPLNLFIACLIKSFVGRRFPPRFTDLVAYGMEKWERHSSDIMKDIDRLEREAEFEHNF